MTEVKSWEEFVASKSIDSIGGSEKIVVSDSGTTKYLTPDLIRRYAIDGLPYITVGPTGSGALYECDGVADNVQIKQAIDYIDTLGGGTVLIYEGTYSISSGLALYTSGHYDNISIYGAGKGKTILQAASAVAMITFGNGNAALDIIPENIHIEGITFDLNNKTSPTYGLVLTTKNTVVKNCSFKNHATGALNYLYLGVGSGASLDFPSQNFRVIDTDFEAANGGTESVLIAQTSNVKFINCTFGSRTGGYSLLNYGSYGVSIVASNFEDCGNGTNAHGDTKFIGCTFLRSSVTIQGDNTTFDTCTIEGDNSAICQLSVLGYIQSGGEAALEAPAANTDVQIKNTKIVNCTFKKCNSVAISAGVFTGYSGSAVLSSKNITIENCTIDSSYWQGTDVKSEYLVVRNCESKNNGQLGTSSVKYNYVFGGKRVLFENNRSYDDQGSPTATTDFFIDDQYSATALTSQDITMQNNNFTIGSASGTLPRYYTGSFTSTKPSGVTLRGSNNDKINPNKIYAQGNVTGATTFTRVNGSTITATLTGSITVTLTDGVIAGDTLTLILTQDGTGSHTATWPSNFKKAGGSLTLTTTAGAVDVIEMQWDGSNWREVSRSLALS